jgi:phosphatidylglycerol lysyltransferase
MNAIRRGAGSPGTILAAIALPIAPRLLYPKRPTMTLEPPINDARTGGAIRRALAWCGRNRELVASAAGVGILVLAFVALTALLREIDLADVSAAIATIAPERWLLALFFTAASFACLIVFDLAALQTLGKTVARGVAARAAVTAYAISNTLGLPLLTGGTVRLNFYTREGLSEADVARVVALAGITFWLGIFAVGALSLPLLPPGTDLGGFVLHDAVRYSAPLLLIGAVGVYCNWARSPRRIRIGGLALPLPGPKLTLAQFAAAALDLAVSAAVIFVLAPSLTLADFPQLLAAFSLALGIAVITHAPGGFGVFEAMVFLLLPHLAKSELAAALLGYRLIYFLVPFAIAVIYLAIREGDRLHRRALPVMRIGGSVARSVAPLVMAAAVFGAGAVLILTGAVPLFPDRVVTITRLLPDSLLDLSHFTSSIIGTLLLFMAWGLYRRLDVAWIASMVLLGCGVVVAMLRALDYVEAGVLGLVFLLLAWTRPAFYRQTAFTSEAPGAGLIIAIAAVFASSLFLGFFSYKHIDYSDALWWEMRPSSNAPRFLRASAGIAIVIALMAARRLTRPAKPIDRGELSPEIWEKALAGAQSAEAHLARTGDKFFLTSDAGDAFLMYRVRGRSFIAMGAPIGPQERWSELVWKFRELADRNGARTVFYRCGPEMLPYAIDLGLSVMKLGEEAHVPLAAFSMEGKPRAKLRTALSRAEREGVTFRVVEGVALENMLSELAEVSQEWLTAKKQREKQFSLGRFDADYLTGGPVAVAETDGRVLAFANLWTLPGREELSFDLMRHRSEVPHGTMDFLFVRLMQWAQEQGYARFSLGVAPLSGIEARRLAPGWARIAGAAFRHGERLYGYAGLRRYKEKFLPEWQGRYFVAPRGYSMARALIDVTLLVSAPLPTDGLWRAEGFSLLARNRWIDRALQLARQPGTRSASAK